MAEWAGASGLSRKVGGSTPKSVVPTVRRATANQGAGCHFNWVRTSNRLTPRHSGNKWLNNVFIDCPLELQYAFVSDPLVLKVSQNDQPLLITLPRIAHSGAENLQVKFRTSLTSNAILLSTGSANTYDRLQLMLRNGKLELVLNFGMGEHVSCILVIFHHFAFS